MKVNEVPKYSCMETVMQLTRRQRAILYRQCVGGRSCYLVDVNYTSGAFFEDCFDQRGVFVGEHVTHRYMFKENEEEKKKLKILEIIKKKGVDVFLVFISDCVEQYNEMNCHGLRVALTETEFNLIKEWLDDNH